MSSIRRRTRSAARSSSWRWIRCWRSGFTVNSSVVHGHQCTVVSRSLQSAVFSRNQNAEGWPAIRSSLPCQQSEGWAHQDSNLGRTGYEPAALTAELWARVTMSQSRSAVASQSQSSVVESRQLSTVNQSILPLSTPTSTADCMPTPTLTTFFLRGTRAACGCGTGGAACAAPWLRSAGCARA